MVVSLNDERIMICRPPEEQTGNAIYGENFGNEDCD